MAVDVGPLILPRAKQFLRTKLIVTLLKYLDDARDAWNAQYGGGGMGLKYGFKPIERKVISRAMCARFGNTPDSWSTIMSKNLMKMHEQYMRIKRARGEEWVDETQPEKKQRVE